MNFLINSGNYLNFLKKNATILQFLMNLDILEDVREIPAKFHLDFDEKTTVLTEFNEILRKSGKIIEILQKSAKIWKFCIWRSAKECIFCRSRKMLKNAYLVAKIGLDTAENEPQKGKNYLRE